MLWALNINAKNFYSNLVFYPLTRFLIVVTVFVFFWNVNLGRHCVTFIVWIPHAFNHLQSWKALARFVLNSHTQSLQFRWFDPRALLAWKGFILSTLFVFIASMSEIFNFQLFFVFAFFLFAGSYHYFISSGLLRVFEACMESGLGWIIKYLDREWPGMNRKIFNSKLS